MVKERDCFPVFRAVTYHDFRSAQRFSCRGVHFRKPPPYESSDCEAGGSGTVFNNHLSIFRFPFSILFPSPTPFYHTIPGLSNTVFSRVFGYQKCRSLPAEFPRVSRVLPEKEEKGGFSSFLFDSRNCGLTKNCPRRCIVFTNFSRQICIMREILTKPLCFSLFFAIIEYQKTAEHRSFAVLPKNGGKAS